jgi:hypothetical protein
MAVDFYHRLVVSGPVAEVRDFRRRMYHEYPRTVAGQSWTEIVPFSFAALYQMAPGAKRVAPEMPFDPLDISVWPVRRVSERRARMRYQFHTRNLEMHGLIRVLSRARPVLSFILVTLCLDDGDIESYRFVNGTCSKWRISLRRRTFHWDRARAKFGLAGDELFEDDEAERWAEEEMLDEALRHWERGKHEGGRLRWFNQPVFHDLESERTIAVAQLSQLIDESAKRGPTRR